jgi:hypothetical protein
VTRAARTEPRSRGRANRRPVANTTHHKHHSCVTPRGPPSPTSHQFPTCGRPARRCARPPANTTLTPQPPNTTTNPLPHTHTLSLLTTRPRHSHIHLRTHFAQQNTYAYAPTTWLTLPPCGARACVWRWEWRPPHVRRRADRTRRRPQHFWQRHESKHRKVQSCLAGCGQSAESCIAALQHCRFADQMQSIVL